MDGHKTQLNIFIQFNNVPFKISRWGENGRTPRKTIWHTRRKNLACLTNAPCGAQTYTRHSDEMIEWLSAVMKYQRS